MAGACIIVMALSALILRQKYFPCSVGDTDRILWRGLSIPASKSIQKRMGSR
jgi:hypothetical protein